MTRQPARVALVALAVAIMASLFLSGSPVSASTNDASPLGTARRVFVFTVPTLSWADLREFRAPNLNRILDDSAVADLSVRSVSRKVASVDGYATLGAGTRSVGSDSGRLAFVAGATRASDTRDVEGDPTQPPAQVFAPLTPDPSIQSIITDSSGDPIEPAVGAEGAESSSTLSALAQEFVRRSGVNLSTGEVYNFGLVQMLRLNEALLFGSKIGSLGSALKSAGIVRAVIANGDHNEGPDTVAYRREATLGLMDSSGRVDGGRVGSRLLQRNARAAYGIRLDIDKVAESFQRFWTDRSVVLVEASDLVRYEEVRSELTDSQSRKLHAEAIARSDALLGRLLQQVDLSRDAVIITSPYAVNGGNSLTVLGVHAPGIRPGLLSSGTTRRAGFVQTTDLAPTILSFFGIAPTASMEGTPVERSATGGSAGDRRAFLADANDAAIFRDAIVTPVSVLFVIAQLVLIAGAILVLSRRARRRWWLLLETASLAVLLSLPTTFLAGLFPFFRWGTAAYWAFLVVVSGASAVVVRLVARARFVDALIVSLGAILLLLSVDVLVGAPLQFNTAFGYSPTVAGRFAGLGNPAFSILAASVIILAALVAHRIGGATGNWVAIGLMVWATLLDGLPFLGSDVGGALTLVPTTVVMGWMLFGRRFRIRTLALAIGGAITITLGFGLLDLARPPEQRTHLGRLLAKIGDQGGGALRTVVLRKLDENLAVLTSSIWTLMVPLAFISVGYVLWRAPGRLRSIGEVVPQERAAVAGLLVAMVLGFALNDSGISIPGIMLGVANAAFVHLLLRVNRLDGLGDPLDGPGLADSGGTDPVSDAEGSTLAGAPI